MPILTSQELIELEALKSVTWENFTVAHAIAYYEYLEGKGFEYGTLALGVVENNTAKGRIANGYAKSVATAHGVDFSVGSDAWKEMQWNLMQQDYDLREQNNGADLTWKQYDDAHANAFNAVNLPPETWTTHTPLNQIEKVNPVLASAVWDDMLQNTGFYDNWFTEGWSTPIIESMV